MQLKISFDVIKNKINKKIEAAVKFYLVIFLIPSVI